MTEKMRDGIIERGNTLHRGVRKARDAGALGESGGRGRAGEGARS